MIRRVLSTLLVVVALLLVTAVPAGARELIGCNGIVQWPCPGPVIVDP